MKNAAYLIFGMLFLLAGSFNTAHACIVPPAHMYLPHDEAIDDAEWIAVAEPVSDWKARSSGFSYPYRMKVLEYIKGAGPDELELPTGFDATNTFDEQEPVEGNFYGHTASLFWTSGGRNYNRPDCRIHEGFRAGRKYLIFGPLDYQNGFENITDQGDAWLQYVRDYLAKKNAVKPFPVSAETYFEEAVAIVRLQASWGGSAADWSIDILKGPELNYMHMIHALPQVTFDNILDPECDSVYARSPLPKKIDQLFVFEFISDDYIEIFQSLECVGPSLSGRASLSSRGKYSINGHQVFAVEDGRGLTMQPGLPKLNLLTDDELTLDHVKALIGQSAQD